VEPFKSTVEQINNVQLIMMNGMVDGTFCTSAGVPVARVIAKETIDVHVG
jgi:hypothetical protein